VLKLATNGGMNLNYLTVSESFPLSATVLAHENLSAYPNPSTDGRYNFLIPESGTLMITTLNGTVIYSHSLTIGKSNIDLSGNASGVYIASLTTQNKSYRFKLIVN
jgi:hypothetical protein